MLRNRTVAVIYPDFVNSHLMVRRRGHKHCCITFCLGKPIVLSELNIRQKGDLNGKRDGPVNGNSDCQ